MKTVSLPEPAEVPAFPLKIRWPGEAKVALISGQWERVGDQIEATYTNIEELRLALELTKIVQEMAADRELAAPSGS